MTTDVGSTDPAVDHLRHHASLHPDRPALIDDRGDAGVRSYSYAEFDAEVDRWAAAILASGVPAGSTVAWCGPNSAESMAITHATRRTGTIAVPVPYKLTVDEAHYIVANSEAALGWADRGYEGLLTADLPRLEPALSGTEVSLDRQAPQTSMLLYTSGTTGRPKGALRHQAGAPGQFGALLDLLWGDDPHVYLTTGPLYHSGPMGFAMRSWLRGSTVVLQHTFAAEDWLRLVDQYRVTTTFSAPTPVRRLVNLPAEVWARYDVSSMRTMIANAAPWTQALKRAYLERFPTDSLWEVYGSTELSVSAVLAPADQLRKPGSCGQLAPGVEMALFDADGVRITEPHTEGDLYVRSAGVFETYYRNDAEFEANNHEGWQTVGDIAYFDEEDYWYICDRRSDMVITGGSNVYPAEVEAVLDECPGVAEVAVIGLPDEEWGEAVHAVIVAADPQRPPSFSTVQSFARERLAGYKTPKAMSIVEDLPRTGSGKVLKRELRERFSVGQSEA